MTNRALREGVNKYAHFQLATTRVVEVKNTQIFRDGAGLDILVKLRHALVERYGYTMRDARPAKGIEAGLEWAPIKGIFITILLGVTKRERDWVSFYLISDVFSSSWRQLPGLRVSPTEIKPYWMKLMQDVEGVLREELSVESLEWRCSEDS